MSSTADVSGVKRLTRGMKQSASQSSFASLKVDKNEKLDEIIRRSQMLRERRQSKHREGSVGSVGRQSIGSTQGYRHLQTLQVPEPQVWKAGGSSNLMGSADEEAPSERESKVLGAISQNIKEFKDKKLQKQLGGTHTSLSLTNLQAPMQSTQDSRQLSSRISDMTRQLQQQRASITSGQHT